MPTSHTLGFPPLGTARELKRATEGYWSGKTTRDTLLATGGELRSRHCRLRAPNGAGEFAAARRRGIPTRPGLLDPLTFWLPGKERGGRFDRLALLDPLFPVYAEAIQGLAAAGAEGVQLDEPCLALDRS